jgi:serine protease Do
MLALLAGACGADSDLKSYGTGFLVDPRGYILTNEHVVHRAKSVKVVLGERDTFPATILSADEDHDLALLKIESDTPLPMIPVGKSSEVKRQQRVLAIGYPFGETAVTSTGGRLVSIRKEGADQLLVTDVVANPGNSGGPLLNDRGEAIGVISSLLMAQVGGTRVKAGEIYAIPISFALPLLAAIPDFDWTAVGAAETRLAPDELDARASPAVAQVLSDRVERGQISGAAGEGEKGFSENATALLTSYVERMELKHEVDRTTCESSLTRTRKSSTCSSTGISQFQRTTPSSTRSSAC